MSRITPLLDLVFGLAVMLLGSFMTVNGLYHLIGHGEISFLSRMLVAPIIVFAGWVFVRQVVAPHRGKGSASRRHRS